MAEPVGSLYYSVTLDTGEMIRGQRNADQALRKTTASLDGFQAKLTQVAGAVGALAAATFLIAKTDAYTKLNAQLKLATDGYSSLSVAQEKVLAISREAQADISAIGVLYARITNATKELGTSQAAVGDITRVVALSMKVSGATAQESSSAMLQLSQAFASGVMRGEEFNSVNEAAPRLMKALADGIGVPIGRLRTLAEAGKLTTSVMVDALPKAIASLEEEAKHVQTVSGAFQVLKNEVMLFVGAQTTANGTAAAAASVLKTLAANLDIVASAAIGIAAAKLSATLLATAVATVANTKATLDGIAAQRASAAAAVATAQAKATETVTTVAAAESELAATGAKIAGMQATQAAIVAARTEAMAKLQSAQASAAQAQTQIAAATAAGALSYALALVRTGTMELAVAQAAQAKQTAELAILGRQQASVSAQITAATAAQTAASRGLIAANAAQATAQMGVNTAMAASAGAMTTARALLGTLGGPVGIITTLLGLGATAWMLWGNNAEKAGDQAAQALAKAQKEHSGYAQDASRYDAIIARERAKGADADEKRITRLTSLRDNALRREKQQWNEIRGMEAESRGREMLDRNYATRYEDPAAVEARQREALKRFHEDNMSDMEKYQIEAAQKRAELGALYTPDVDAKLRKKHKLDKKDPNAGKAESAQQYYQGLVADNASALAKIDAQEQEALAENAKRAAKDLGSAATYAKAKGEIQKKFARERALFEEENQKDIADLSIELTTSEVAKIEAIRAEEFRRADAAVRLGVKTFAEGERAKTLAAFREQQAKANIAERLNQAVAENAVAATTDEMARIDMIRQESYRRADAAVKAGAITFADGEAAKARAAIDAQNAIQQKVLSINPLAALTKEYEEKLAIVRFYEEQMALAGVNGTEFVEAKRLELTRSYQQQRLALAEAEFSAQSAGNQFMMDSLNSLASTASSSITGLINGTMTASEAMRGLANVVLSEAVGALAQIGLQYIKNAVMGQVAEKALMATKAANAAAYTAAVSAQVAVNSSLAAAAAFASTAAIPIVGPMLAPAAAGAAAAAAAALGAPAIAAAPLAGARQYGGPVSAGSLYRINETGQPEMFTGSNGSQYMLPTKSGNVTPANQVGSGATMQPIVNVINQHPTAQVSAKTNSRGEVDVTIAEVVSQIRNNSGPVWSALRGSTNIGPRL